MAPSGGGLTALVPKTALHVGTICDDTRRRFRSVSMTIEYQLNVGGVTQNGDVLVSTQLLNTGVVKVTTEINFDLNYYSQRQSIYCILMTDTVGTELQHSCFPNYKYSDFNIIERSIKRLYYLFILSLNLKKKV